MSGGWIKYTSSQNNTLNSNSILSSSSSNTITNGNRSTVRGADKGEQKLLGYLQKQSKSQLPNSNVKIYKKKWFWFEPDSGTLFYSTTSTGSISTPLTPSTVLDGVKSIPIKNTTIIEQSISFRLELIITDKIKNKIYNLRANDETTILNWVNTLNQWKKLNCNIEINKTTTINNTTTTTTTTTPSLSITGSSSSSSNDIDIETLLNTMSVPTTISSLSYGCNSIKPMLDKIQTTDSNQLKFVLSQVEQQISYLKSCKTELLSYLANGGGGTGTSIGSSIGASSSIGNDDTSLSSYLSKRYTGNSLTTQSNLDIGNSLSYSNSIILEDLGNEDDDEEDDALIGYQSYYEITDIFSQLPQHLSLFIFSYLNATDLLISAQVSIQWQKLANDNLLWIRFVQHFITPASVFDKTHNWKSVYIANQKSIGGSGGGYGNGELVNGVNGSNGGSGNGNGIDHQKSKEKYMNRTISMYGINPLNGSLSTTKEGWLYKRGDDLLRIWKKRYFVLRDCSLFYFKHQNDNFPCGVILLTHGTTRLKRASQSTRKNCFKILQSKQSGVMVHNKKRMPYYLASDKEDDCNDWMNLLINSIKSNQQHQNNYGIINIGNNGNGSSNVGSSSNNLPPLLTKQQSFNNQNQFNNMSNKPSRKSHKKSFSSSSTPSGNFDPTLPTNTVVNNTPLVPIYPMFGIAISKILDNQSHIATQTHLKIPFLLFICLNHIISKGTLEEGVFRVSGSLREVQELQEDFEQGREIDLDSHDIHAVCGLVKTFFRKLPHTLVPSDLDKYSTSVQLATSQTEEEKISEFKFIFENISKNTYHIFELFFYLLRQIVKNEAVNKMTVENLLIVIMPTLQINPVLVTNGIKYYDQIFK